MELEIKYPGITMTVHRENTRDYPWDYMAHSAKISYMIKHWKKPKPNTGKQLILPKYKQLQQKSGLE